MKKEIYVRNLEKRDLPAIVSMEERQTGVARPDYWEKRIEISEAIRPHWASLVAELDNRVVGFVLGRAGEFEFGLPGTVAWIEIIGVDPAHRRRGIAQELVEQFAESRQDAPLSKRAVGLIVGFQFMNCLLEAHYIARSLRGKPRMEDGRLRSSILYLPSSSKGRTMDFELPEELAEVQKLARDFSEKEIARARQRTTRSIFFVRTW